MCSTAESNPVKGPFLMFLIAFPLWPELYAKEAEIGSLFR